MYDPDPVKPVKMQEVDVELQWDKKAAHRF